MKWRFWLMPALGAVAMAIFMLAQQVISARSPAAAELKPATTLPISRVVLFSSGVAHFSRTAEIDGNARIDLTFPEQDINDLIKSMVLQDFSEKGRVSAVTYDSHEPIDRTLKSFAINLHGNPSFAEILVQARGEKVEAVLQQNAVGQPGTITGSIIGVEHQIQAAPGGPIGVEVLNLWCAEGIRSVRLNEIQRLRFQNPVIESEFRRALETLSLAHDTQKKAVSLNFSGEGKRKVQVNYVTESPIWKTSYRLVLDKNEKPNLQGWAVVENTTDEDWSNVEMALVSGRPISFKMDLYNPLYVQRPFVEPELFASLRPPTYSGMMAANANGEFKNIHVNSKDRPTGSFMIGAGVSSDAGYSSAVTQMKFQDPRLMNDLFLYTSSNRPISNVPNSYSFEQPILKGYGIEDRALEKKKDFSKRLMKEFGRLIEEGKYRDAGQVAALANQIDPNNPTVAAAMQISRMAFRRDKWDQSKEDKERFHYLVGNATEQRSYLANPNPNDGPYADIRKSVETVATAAALGDYFQYVIDQPVNLGRQKSALLPIINKDVEATRVSIYNSSVQPKHPLLGLKFKNTTGTNLSQGPITVFEGSTYAGDTRVLDLQPNEDRLVSYAIDLGTEVSAKNDNNISLITKIKAQKGIIFVETMMREARTYDISNRSDSDRTILIEHPNRKGEGFYFVGDHKPAEEAADVYRFQVAVAAKKNVCYTVLEERTQGSSVTLTNNSDDQIRFFLSLHQTSPALKQRLDEAMNLKARWDDVRREIAKVNERIGTITNDQERIRQNLRDVPNESAAYKRYLTKFDDQEMEMDSLHAKLKELQERDNKSQTAYEEFLRNITVD